MIAHSSLLREVSREAQSRKKCIRANEMGLRVDGRRMAMVQHLLSDLTESERLPEPTNALTKEGVRISSWEPLSRIP